MIDFSSLCIAKTKQDARQFRGLLKDLDASLYSKEKNTEKKVYKIFNYHQASQILSFCAKNKIDISDRKQFQIFLKDLSEYIERLPNISITLAFEPREDTISEVYDWFLLNLKKPVILDVHVDELLIAGAVVSCNGRYKDASIRKRIEEEYAKKVKND